MNTHCTQTHINLFEKPQGEPEARPLDYLYTKVTRVTHADVLTEWGRRREKKRCQRFPSDRWHTLSFRDFAWRQEHMIFGHIGLDYEGNIMKKKGRCLPRWSDAYRKRTYARIKQFVRVAQERYGLSEDASGNVAIDRAHFVTLSVQHPRSESKKAAVQVVDDLRYAWQHIRRWVNRKDWQYLRVAEPGENITHVHFHMIVLGASDEEIEQLKIKWVAACNKHGNKASLKAQDSSRAENIRNLGGYITKYIAKTFADGSAEDDEWFWKWMELCYSSRLRVFAMDSRSSKICSEKYKDPFDDVRDLMPGYKLGETLFVPGDKKVDEILSAETVATAALVKREKLRAEADAVLSSAESIHTDPINPPILLTAPRVGGRRPPDETRDSGAERVSGDGRGGDVRPGGD